MNKNGNKEILNFLIKNTFFTILILDFFALIVLFIGKTYFEKEEVNNRAIGVSPLLIHFILGLLLFLYFFISTLPVYLNLVKSIRKIPVYRFLSFFLIPAILLVTILYLKNFDVMIVVISTACLLLYVNYYCRFIRFIKKDSL